MKAELSIAELEGELVTELPKRDLMHHHRHHSRRFSHRGGMNGSVTNVNHTTQIIVNPQVAVNLGRGNINQFGGNSNRNSSTQIGIPVHG